MLLQKSQIGKTAVLFIILLLLAALAAMPLLLQANSTGETTPEAELFLPIVYNEAENTPDSSEDATPTPTNSQTPVPTHLPTNTPIPAITPTSVPADLIVGQPILIGTPPIIVYQPVSFQVPITNTGDIAINNLFFVDLLFDPLSTHPMDVYAAVSGLSGNKAVTLTITSTIGFANFAGTHQVTGWVDSLDHISEGDETNNLSEPLEVFVPDYGGTPTSTPIPGGAEVISGIARVFLNGSYLLQERMLISVVDEASDLTIASTYSDETGFYQFENLPTGTYTVQGCITINNNEYFGFRSGRTPPDSFADIFANEQLCP